MKKYSLLPCSILFLFSFLLSCQQKTTEQQKIETPKASDSVSLSSKQVEEPEKAIPEEKITVVGSDENDYYFYNWPDSFYIRSNGSGQKEYQNFRISTPTNVVAEIEFRPWAHAFGLAAGKTGYTIAGFDAYRDVLNDGRIQYSFESLSADPDLSSNIYSIKIFPDYEKWILKNFSVKKPGEEYEFLNLPETIFPISFPSNTNKVGITFKFNHKEKNGIPNTDLILQLTNFDLITFNEIKVASFVGKPELVSKFKEEFVKGNEITHKYWYAGQGGTITLRHEGEQLVFEQLMEEEVDMETAEKIERGEIQYKKPKPEILHSWPIPENANLSFVRYKPMSGS